MKNLKYFCILLILLLPGINLSIRAEEEPVVVVSSYNPDVANVSAIIEAFNHTYNESGCKTPVVLENMNCLNLTESPKWKARLWGLLEKYYANGHQPAAIVLLGAEASTTFFSIKREEFKKTPVILGLRSNSIIELPEDGETELSTWDPEAKYLTHDYKDYNIVGGCIYRHNIGKNFELIDRLFPKSDSLIFISDNTLGGVTMLAHFKDVHRSYPKYHIDYLDGRTHTLFEVNDSLSQVSSNHVIVIGTWRIDSFDNFTMSNSTYTLAQNAADVPAITLSSVGKGHWAFGGYTPHYSNSGSRIANSLIKFLQTGRPDTLTMLPSGYFFDYNKVKKLQIEPDKLGEEYEMLNEPVGFIQRHWIGITVVASAFAFLSLALFFSLYYISRNRKLTKELASQSKELIVALKRAEEANLMKSQFIANMSHEIRTPLNAVVGFSQLLTMDGIEMTEEEKRDITSRIILNTDLLLKLINDILDLSRMDAGRTKMNIQDVEFVSLIQMATDSSKVNLSKEIEMTYESTVKKLNMKTDPERMTQVISNLLSNAKKCTEKGSIKVNLSYKPGDAMVTVSVTDTGCGIPSDKAEKIFRRFEKLDEFKQGTGLGLSITRAIIEQLGGQIYVDTSYKNGARFVFNLPVINC